jgi:hypothetical protein
MFPIFYKMYPFGYLHFYLQRPVHELIKLTAQSFTTS